MSVKIKMERNELQAPAVGMCRTVGSVHLLQEPAGTRGQQASDGRMCGTWGLRTARKLRRLFIAAFVSANLMPRGADFIYHLHLLFIKAKVFLVSSESGL